jgi:hypothetical protein
MAELPSDYERNNLDLSVEYKSEEAIKSRRNIHVATFVVICLWMLCLPPSELKLFGVELSDVNSSKLSSIAFLLFSYWLFMYSFYSYRDKGFNSERRFLLKREEEKVEEQYNKTKAKLAEKMGEHQENLSKSMHGQVKVHYDVYINQKNRMKVYNGFNKMLNLIELFSPVILGLTSIFLIYFTWK